MPLTDSTVTFQSVATPADQVRIDFVVTMGIDIADVMVRDINDNVYQRDIGSGGFIPEIRLNVIRNELDPADVNQLFDWIADDEEVYLWDHANLQPIGSYRGKIAKLQPDMVQSDGKIGFGPFMITFYPHATAEPLTGTFTIPPP